VSGDPARRRGHLWTGVAMCPPIRRFIPFLFALAPAALWTSCGVTGNPQGPSSDQSSPPVSSSSPPAPQPAVALSSTAVTFTARQSGSNPASQSIAVTNGGQGTLSGLSARITYSGQSQGWLEASLARTTAPTTLTLRATTTGLDSGTHQAVVRVLSSTAMNGPQSLSVDFVVGSRTSPPLPAPTLSFVDSSVYPLVSISVDGKEYVDTVGDAVAPGGHKDVPVPPGRHQYRMVNGTFQGDSSFVEMYVAQGSYSQPDSGTYTVTFDDPPLERILSDFQQSWTWTSEVAHDCSAQAYQYRFTFRSDGTYDLAEIGKVGWTVIRTGTYHEKGARQPSFTISVETSADGDGLLEELTAVLTISNARDSCSGVMKYHEN
jgi:hypothetical protein